MNETDAKKRYEDLKASYEAQTEKVATSEKAVEELPSKIAKMEKDLDLMRNDLAKANSEHAKVTDELPEKRYIF